MENTLWLYILWHRKTRIWDGDLSVRGLVEDALWNISKEKGTELNRMSLMMPFYYLFLLRYI